VEWAWKITPLEQNMLVIPKLMIRINLQDLLLILLILLFLINFSWPCHAQNKLLTTEEVILVKSLFSLNH